MSLWTLVGISSQVEATSGALALSEPAGCQDGDLLIACISYRSNAAFTTPSGWTNTDSENTGNTTVNGTGSIASAHMDHRVRNGAVSGVSWARTGGDLARGAILAYRLSSGTPVFDQSTSNTLASASVTLTSGTMTTAEDGELLVMLMAGASNVTFSAEAAATDPVAAAWTEHTDAGSTNAADGSLAVASAVKNLKGATGQFSATASASRRNAMIVGAFRARYNVVAEAASFAVTGNAITDPGPVITRTDGPDIEAITASSSTLKSAQSLGAASAQRIIVVSLAIGGLVNISDIDEVVTSVEIDGTPMIREISSGSSVVGVQMYYLPWPTGTTADIELFFGTGGGSNLEFSLWAVTGGDGLLASSGVSNVTATPGGASFNSPYKFVRHLGLSVGPLYSSANTARHTWTGSVEHSETSPNLAGAGGVNISHAIGWETVETQPDTVSVAYSGASILSDQNTTAVLVFGPEFDGVRASSTPYAVTANPARNPGVMHTTPVYAQPHDTDNGVDTNIWSSVSVGAAATDRLLLFCVRLFGDLAAATPVGATFDGNPVTLELSTNTGFNAGILWFSFANDALTEGEFQLEFTADASEFVTYMAVFNITGADVGDPVFDTAALADDNSDGSESISIDIAGTGEVFGAALGTGSTNNTQSFTGLNEEYDTPIANALIDALGSFWSYGSVSAHSITSTDAEAPPTNLTEKVLSAVSISPAGQTAGIIADSTPFTVTSVNAGLIYPRTFAITSTPYTITGIDADELTSVVFVTEVTPFEIGSFDVELRRTAIIADVAAFDVTGIDAQLFKTILFSDLIPGEFLVTGLDANFRLRARNEWQQEGDVNETWTQQITISGGWVEESSTSNTWTKETLE